MLRVRHSVKIYSAKPKNRAKTVHLRQGQTDKTCAPLKLAGSRRRGGFCGCARTGGCPSRQNGRAGRQRTAPGPFAVSFSVQS